MHEHERRTRSLRANLHDVLLYRGARERLTSRWERVAGVRAHARVAETADGPPVVFVHGVAVSSRYLVPTAARVAERCRVYVPDLPGFGRSPSAGLHSVAGLADALREWLDVLGLDRPALVANSFGCQLVAALPPERVGAAVLVGPTVDRRARAWLPQTARLAVDIAREPLALDVLQAFDYAVFMVRGGCPTFQAMLRDRVEERLPRIDAQAVVVRGARDPIVSQRWAEEVTELLPDARLFVVPGAPHAVNYAAPDALAQIVLDLVT